MPPLLLLHGALGASPQFDSLIRSLGAAAPGLATATLDFEGHGRGERSAQPFRIERFAANVLDRLDRDGLDRVTIFGYSMGGYVALHLAVAHPERVAAVVTLATKFRWTPDAARREGRMLDPATMEAKVPHFVRALAERHPAGWTDVVHRTREMMEALGDRPLLDDAAFAGIAQPVRICVGDRDATVSVEESAGVARLIPRGELEVLPATPHPLEKAPVERVARTIVEFVTTGA
jgi:pimeloyl-ACP methyl ester carboxylesterase